MPSFITLSLPYCACIFTFILFTVVMADDDKNQLQNTIDGYSKQISELQQKANDATGDEKDKIQGQINELNTKKENAMSEFKDKFGELGQTGSDALKNITDKI